MESKQFTKFYSAKDNLESNSPNFLSVKVSLYTGMCQIIKQSRASFKTN